MLVEPVTRRRFLAAAAATAGWPLIGAAQRTSDAPSALFRHGVASGDPLADRVILWTRVTPSAIGGAAPIDVRWQIAEDDSLSQVVGRGTALAARERDFTVKIDAAGLRPGRPYFFAFEAGGDRSPIGRTRTLPERADRLLMAVVSCANYPAGFFNVYRLVADRDDLDLVVHLGDYIYESADGADAIGAAMGRVPQPPHEAVTLGDYRLRYATYRTDADLQEAHRRHPFVAVWDDHETANNAWSGGATGHTGGMGPWAARQAAAARAYMEWMPVRETAGDPGRLYRAFRIGTLADLLLLDTRSLRDRQVPGDDPVVVADPKRSLLGAAQESWLVERLEASRSSGTAWRLLGQQVMFGAITPPGVRVRNVDQWDGYPAARQRVFDALASKRITDVAILTGDIHSSWAIDLPRDPYGGGYTPASGGGSLAVEFVTPAVSSPPLFSIAGVRETAPLLRLAAPHIKYLEGERRGYILLDVTRERVLADWHLVPSVTERSTEETRAARFVCERGSSHLVAG